MTAPEPPREMSRGACQYCGFLHQEGYADKLHVKVRELEAAFRETSTLLNSERARAEKEELESKGWYNHFVKARDRSERWAKAYNDAIAERDRLTQRIKHFETRTLEQAIHEEWAYRGMHIKETFDTEKMRWTIELLQEDVTP